jgi:DNA-binding transcriptional LysR family regulator
VNKLKLIEAFIDVSSAGSLSAAAAKNGVSASAVSKQMTELERVLGCKLVERTRQDLTLTPAGKFYLGEVIPMVQRLRELDEQVKGFADEPEGTLRVGASKLLATYLVAPNMEAFYQRYPALRVSLVEYGRDEDVALYLGMKPTGGTGEVFILGRQSWIALVSSQSPLKYVVEPSELVPPFFCWDDGTDANGWEFRNGERVVKRAFRPQMTSVEFESLLSAIQAGKGVALMPSWLGPHASKFSRFARVLSHWEIVPSGKDVAVVATVPSSKTKLSNVKSFIGHMKRTFREFDSRA